MYSGDNYLQSILLSARRPFQPVKIFKLPRLDNRVGGSLSPSTQSLPIIKPSESITKRKKSSFIDELIKKYSEDNIVNNIFNPPKFQLFWSKCLTRGSMPYAREGASFTYLNGKFYMFGGQARKRYNDFRIFDPITLHWQYMEEIKGHLPQPRMGHSAIGYKNSLFIYGGRGEFNQMLQIRQCFADLWIFDSVMQQFRVVQVRNEKIQPRRSHCVSILGSTMIIYGGLNSSGQILGDVRLLNLDSFQWIKFEIENNFRPKARFHSQMTAYFSYHMIKQVGASMFGMRMYYDDYFTVENSGFYVFGGETIEGLTSELWLITFKKVQDKNVIKWQKLKPQGEGPCPRSGHCQQLFKDSIFIIGGKLSQSLIQSSKVDIHAYEIQQNKWKLLSVQGWIPSFRWGAYSGVTGTRILFFGGLKFTKYCNMTMHFIETEMIDQLEQQYQEQMHIRRLRSQKQLKPLRISVSTGIRSPLQKAGHNILLN